MTVSIGILGGPGMGPVAASNGAVNLLGDHPVNESTRTSHGFENFFVPGEEVPFWSSQPLIVALIALCELGPADSEC